MSIQETRDRIHQALISAQPKRAFLVEGMDDQQAFRILLERFVPGWEQRWAIAVAGNKRQLQKLLALEPGWLGVVDRDEWDQHAITAKTSELTNLMVLPRFCLESYLINPTELWYAIPPDRQTGLSGGEASLRAAIELDLRDYLRHGALWRVVTPLWSGLRALGFKEALASESSVGAAQDDTQIRRILGDWGTLLDPERIFADFQAQFTQANSAAKDEQYAHWIHGKLFWRNVVNPAMNQLLGPMSESERRIKILHRLLLPADLQPLFDRLAQ